MALRDIYWRGEDDYRSRPARVRTSRPSRPATGLLGILWHRRVLICATILGSLLLGAGYLAVTPPRYLATSMILIDPRLGKVVGSDPVQPGFVTDSAAMDSQINLFTSQTVLTRVAKMAKLADDSEFNGSDRGLLSRILHPQPFLVGSVDLKALEDAITIKRPERTYVVQVDVLARDPNKAASIANDVVQAYIDDQVSSRVGSAREDGEYVQTKLDKLSAEIRVADEKIEAYKKANKIIDANGLRSNEQQVGDLTRTLSEAQARTSDAQARLTEIDRLAASDHLDAASQALNSLTIERLRQQQGEAEESVARLETTLGSRHPELLEAKSRATKIDNLIHDELQRLRLSAQSNYDTTKKNEDQIRQRVEALKTTSTGMSEKLVPLQELERKAGLLRSSFQRFSQVSDNLAQQESDSPPGRIINVARAPVSPARPKKTLTLLISLAAGSFLGVAAALFLEGTDESRGPAPIEPYAPPQPAHTPPPRNPRRYWDDDDDASA